MNTVALPSKLALLRQFNDSFQPATAACPQALADPLLTFTALNWSPQSSQSHGSLGAQRIVPRDYCFDVGRSVVKPPLVAVLDKLAQRLQRKPAARAELLAAPGDGAASSPLAQQDADGVRTHLIARGVSSEGLGPSTTTTVAEQLRVGLASP